MNTASASNVLPLPSVQLRNGGWAKRPVPYVRKLAEGEAWDPVATPLYSLVDGQPVRAGTAFAITRPGMERWPLGVASDHFRVVPWQSTRDAIVQFCAGAVRPVGTRVAGHGYHVMQAFAVEHLQTRRVEAHGERSAADYTVEGAAVTARLVVVNSYTGGDALRAAMVVYVGDHPIGSVVSTRAMHVASQPEHWQGQVDAMIETAILAEDAILDLLKAAAKRELDDADRAFFKGRGMSIKDDAATVLQAVFSWHKGRTKEATFGVWERRLDDEAVVALVVLLGRDVHGAALDDALGLTRRNGDGEVTGGRYRSAR